MNPTFHLFCRISPASPPACRPLSPPALLPASAVRLRRPLSPPAFAVRFRPPSCAPPVCIRGPGVCSPAARFASLLRVLLCVPARPVPRRLLRSLPCPPPLSLPGFRSSPPRPAGPAAPVPSLHGPSGPPSSARRCSRTIPRPCTRRETPSPAVWRSAVSGR